MEYRYLFFDLDGTLTDPAEGITNSVAFALEHFGIHVADRRILFPYIGPPLTDAFTEFSGLTRGQASEAVGYFREYFVSKGIFENHPYVGIREVLGTLRDTGRTLVLATSKPEEFARQILTEFRLAEFFTYVCGATMDERRTKKGEVIAYALDVSGNPNSESVLMIGDRKQDVLGARENGMDSMGVLYGYGSRSELEEAGATYLCESVESLARSILS